MRLTRQWSTGADLALRAVIIISFVPHSLGKLFDTEAFAVKFDVPSWQVYALGAIELAAAAAMLVGAFLYRNRAEIVTRAVVTRLGALGVLVSQVLAIAYAHHQFLEYVPNGNMEYNIALILVALALASAPVLGVRTPGRVPDE